MKIKECPFCGFDGEKAVDVKVSQYKEEFGYLMYCYCDNCGMRGPPYYGEKQLDTAGALELWNIRYDPEHPEKVPLL